MLTVGVELTANRFYEVIISSVLGDTNSVSNLVAFWAEATASKHKALLDRVEVLITALAWTDWEAKQIEVAWSPLYAKGIKYPRCMVCPSDEPEDHEDRTNVEYAAVYPIRIYLIDRIRGRKGSMEDLLIKREELCALFQKITSLQAIEGVYHVEVVPFAIVLDEDIAKDYYAAGISIRVHVNELRGA